MDTNGLKMKNVLYRAVLTTKQNALHSNANSYVKQEFPAIPGGKMYKEKVPPSSHLRNFPALLPVYTNEHWI